MFRFHNWRVYQDARALRLEIETRIFLLLPSEEKYALKDQLRRAINSVILNIAEGAYRKTDKDFGHFLNQALASLYEVVSCFDLMKDSGYIDDVIYHEFLDKCESLAKQISSFSRKLYNK